MPAVPETLGVDNLSSKLTSLTSAIPLSTLRLIPSGIPDLDVICGGGLLQSCIYLVDNIQHETDCTSDVAHNHAYYKLFGKYFLAEAIALTSHTQMSSTVNKPSACYANPNLKVQNHSHKDENLNITGEGTYSYFSSWLPQITRTTTDLNDVNSSNDRFGEGEKLKIAWRYQNASLPPSHHSTKHQRKHNFNLSKRTSVEDLQKASCSLSMLTTCSYRKMLAELVNVLDVRNTRGPGGGVNTTNRVYLENLGSIHFTRSEEGNFHVRRLKLEQFIMALRHVVRRQNGNVVVMCTLDQEFASHINNTNSLYSSFDGVFTVQEYLSSNSSGEGGQTYSGLKSKFSNFHGSVTVNKLPSLNSPFSNLQLHFDSFKLHTSEKSFHFKSKVNKFQLERMYLQPDDDSDSEDRNFSSKNSKPIPSCANDGVNIFDKLSFTSSNKIDW